MWREVSKVEDDDRLLLQNVLELLGKALCYKLVQCFEKKTCRMGGVRSASGFRSVVDTNQSYPCAPMRSIVVPCFPLGAHVFSTLQHNALK